MTYHGTWHWHFDTKLVPHFPSHPLHGVQSQGDDVKPERERERDKPRSKIIRLN